jgi:hypothetical protein
MVGTKLYTKHFLASAVTELLEELIIYKAVTSKEGLREGRI